MCSVIDEILNIDLEPKATRVKFDFSRLTFIDPTAITVLSNLIEFLRKKRVRIEYLHTSYATEGNRFLDDSGFFEQYVGKRSFVKSALRPTTLPLQLITHERSHSWIENTFSPWIENIVGGTDDSFTVIKLCLGEVFNNIRDHSGERVGSVFGQYYPKNHTVWLSISDFGKGIPTNVRKEFPAFSDATAIIKATEQGYTTKSTIVNQGAGLYILTKNVVEHNGGEIRIKSLRGNVRCIKATAGIRKLPSDERTSYPGTLLELQFNIDNLGLGGAKEAFSW